MLMNISHDTRREHNRLLVAGIAYLVAMALLIAVSIAIYQKVFTKVTWVTVDAQQAGLQLPKFGDVRMHGVLVGQIRSISQDGHKAVIKLGLQPDAAKQIPANVSVKILPTTLFGQKYVELVDPTDPAPQSLSDGTVIPASRVTTSVELQTILGKLYPLLTAVKPQDLDETLYAVAHALQGNGERLGQMVTTLDSYLRTMNVHLPTLGQDMSQLASVAHTYSLAAPDLVSLLKNATTTANTISSERRQFHGLLYNVTGLSNDSTTMLARNEAGIDAEGRLSEPLTKLLATYSPEYPCLLEGLDKYTARLNQIFRHSRVYQTMTFGGDQRPAYTRQDRPQYGEIGHGPWCLGLPVPAHAVSPVTLKDGTEDDPAQHPMQGSGK